MEGFVYLIYPSASKNLQYYEKIKIRPDRSFFVLRFRTRLARATSLGRNAIGLRIFS